MTRRRDLGKKKVQPQSDKPPLSAILDHFQIEYRDCFGWQRMKCPFHDEATPSFSVNLEEGAFVCKAYACGKSGGDAFEFIKLMDGVDYPTALKTAEGITGVSYGSVSGGSSAQYRVDRVSEDQGYRPAYGRRVSARRSR